MLKTQILEIFSECCKCRNKIIAVTNSHSTHHNSEIFGQGDPGKTPYNSWGKPVQNLLLISGKCFYSKRNIQQKISKQTFTTYLVFRASQLTAKTCKQRNRTTINVVRPPRFLCQISALNAAVQPA